MPGTSRRRRLPSLADATHGWRRRCPSISIRLWRSERTASGTAWPSLRYQAPAGTDRPAHQPPSLRSSRTGSANDLDRVGGWVVGVGVHDASAAATDVQPGPVLVGLNNPSGSIAG